MTGAEFARLVKDARRRADGQWWDGKCPAHGDRHASLSFCDGDTGALIVKCHAGCTVESVARSLGLEVRALCSPNVPVPRPRGSARRREVAVYDYTDAAGALGYQNVRYEPKDFRLRRPDGRGGWTWNLNGVRRVLYRLPTLAEQARVVWTEGEKDADRLAALGLVATTTAGGANAWRDDYAEQAAKLGIREVLVLPDHDTPGEGYARAGARSLRARGIRVAIVRLPGLGEHGDVSDWLNAGHTAAELAQLLERAAGEATTEQDAEPETPAPTLAVEGDDYRLTWPQAGAELRLTALHEDSTGLHAEATVTLKGALLSWGRLNLTSTRGRTELVDKLERIAPDVDWRLSLERACFETAARFRQGAPTVALTPAPRPAGQVDLIAGVLPAGETSVLYGDGDAGKGRLALLIALAVLMGKAWPCLTPTRRVRRVLYLDWESSKEDLEARLFGLCRGHGVTFPPEGMVYREMTRALAEEAPRIRADIAKHAAEVVIVDSLGPACGAEPESADAAIRAMNALRSFAGTTRLVVAHVSKVAADQSKGATRPYGSVFVRNLARSAWELRRSSEADEDLVVAAYHRKRNEGRRSPPFGLRLSFDNGLVTVADSRLTESSDLLARATIAQQIRAALANGAKTIPALALELDAREDSVKKALHRLRDRRAIVQIPGDKPPHSWGLAQR